MTTHDSRLQMPSRTAFIGGGNMARSLIAGLRTRGVDGSAIAVAEPQQALRDALTAEFGLRAYEHAHEAVADAELVVLAVKPQVMRSVCEALRGRIEHAVALSVAAGIPCTRLSEWTDSLRVARAMPNTPALLGAGATGLYAPAAVGRDDRERAEAVLASVGLCVWVEDEALMDVVTALSGSGPAYFFLMVEALVDAAVAAGLPRGTALPLARQTALGAARMLMESGEAPDTLRRRVTSPGGTTQAAIEALQEGAFESLLESAIMAAVQRGRELGS